MCARKPDRLLPLRVTYGSVCGKKKKNHFKLNKKQTVSNTFVGRAGGVFFVILSSYSVCSKNV